MPKVLDVDYSRFEKNYLINADMRVAQRGTSFVAAADGTYSVDRFRYNKSGAMVHTLSQDTDVPTLVQANYLFQNSLRLNLTTPDTAIAAGDYTIVDQRVEGYNWVNLAQKQFTLSFWVKATLTGTYCVAFQNAGGDRSYVAEYTINTTATWEYKTVTVVASPSAGTWDYTNGIGLRVIWTIAAGTTFQTTAGSWQTGLFAATSNQVNGVNTGATDFRITGVMLNEGQVAAPFKLFNEDVSTELSACQRYYEGGTKRFYLSASGDSYTGDGFRYAVPKRAAPTLTITDTSGNSGKLTTITTNNGGTTVNQDAVVVENGATQHLILHTANTVIRGTIYIWIANSEL